MKGSYPLNWPDGWPRSKGPRQSSFDRKRSLFQAGVLLKAELRRLGVDVSSVVLSTNLVLNHDGTVRSGQKQPADKGVAAYFNMAGGAHVLACDRWDRIECNVYAIALHINAIRAQERYGVGTLEQAFRGYAALPPKPTWWQVLGVTPTASAAEVEAAFREKALRAHPDQGGSTEEMARLNAARAEARRSAS